MSSRRRRTPPRQTGQDRSTQQVTAPQGGPSGRALIKDRISTTPVRDDDRHFKTGRWGRLARFFVRQRAAGDPYEETLVLPALIVIITMKLNDLNWLDAWTVVAAVMVTGIMAGAWIAASLDPRTLRLVLRIFLRAISAGAIESAGYALVYAGKFKFSSAVAANFIIVNLMMYWISAIVVSIIHDYAVITETEWQAQRARLALLRNFILGQSTDGALRSPQATIRAKRRWWQAARTQLSAFIRFLIETERVIRGFLRGLLFWWAVLLFVLVLVAPKLGTSLSQLVQFFRPP